MTLAYLRLWQDLYASVTQSIRICKVEALLVHRQMVKCCWILLCLLYLSWATFQGLLYKLQYICKDLKPWGLATRSSWLWAHLLCHSALQRALRSILTLSCTHTNTVKCYTSFILCVFLHTHTSSLKCCTDFTLYTCKWSDCLAHTQASKVLFLQWHFRIRGPWKTVFIWS